MRAWLNLRYTVPERRQAFIRGLERCGYSVFEGTTMRPGDRDIFVTWNRIREGETVAREFESRGLPVLVTENAAWGNEFAGRRWYSLARSRHNTAGCFEEGGPERWDSLGAEPEPLRTEGETVILPQRGIGSPPTAMPRGWAEKALRKHGGRIRTHPGRNACTPLRDDLAKAGTVVTWGSGAAILASLWGCRVVSEMPDWIGAHPDRLAMFRRLAWAQWTLEEIASGEAIQRMLA